MAVQNRSHSLIQSNPFPFRLHLPVGYNCVHFDKFKEMGGEVSANPCGKDVFAIAPPGFMVPLNSIHDYYSVNFVKACVEMTTVVCEPQYIVEKGTRAPSLDNDVGEDTLSQSLDAITSRHGRTEFTVEEDMEILNFVLSKCGSVDNFDKKIPVKEWNFVANKGQFKNHSGESLRARFTRVIQKNLEKYTALYNTYLANGKIQSSMSELKKKSRNEFTLEEDMSILRFVSDGNLSLIRKEPNITNKEWNAAADIGTFGKHSGDSVRSRYYRVIMKDIEKYESLWKSEIEQPRKQIHSLANINSQVHSIQGSQFNAEPLLQSTPMEKNASVLILDVVASLPLNSDSSEDNLSESDSLKQEDVPKRSVLAQFVSNSENLDVEHTQTVSNNMTLVQPRRITRRHKKLTSTISEKHNTPSKSTDLADLQLSVHAGESSPVRDCENTGFNGATDSCEQQKDDVIIALDDENLFKKSLLATHILAKKYEISPSEVVSLLNYCNGSFEETCFILANSV